MNNLVPGLPRSLRPLSRLDTPWCRRHSKICLQSLSDKAIQRSELTDIYHSQSIQHL